jgi:transcriptional regulator with XRE-family HTH domain
LPTEAQQFSIRLLDQLKANGHPTSATYLARQCNVTPHAAWQWLNGLFIPKEQYMQALAKWLKVDPRWLRYGGVLEDSFVADYMSLCDVDRAIVRAVVGGFFKVTTPNWNLSSEGAVAPSQTKT